MQQGEQAEPQLVGVGVDASPESVEAARFAAAEAAARHLDLLVVHAVAPGSGRSVRGIRDAAGSATRRAAGQALVDATLSQVRVAPRTVVHTAVQAAPAAALMTAWTSGAALLVLGQHQLDLADGRLAGQVAPSVAASARCPVVVVPAGWSRTVVASAHLGPRPVVVGVSGHGSAAAVLRVAYEEADLRRSSVLILHASARADLPVELRAASERTVAEIVAGHSQDHPDVVTDYRLVSAATVLTWVEASTRAGLMVLGRPAGLHGRRTWNHSLAHAMLHQTRCPLVVVPPPALWPADEPRTDRSRGRGWERSTTSADDRPRVRRDTAARV